MKRQKAKALSPILRFPSAEATSPNWELTESIMRGAPSNAKSNAPQVVERIVDVPNDLLRGIAAIATSAWRAKNKMVDRTNGEVRAEMARVFKDVERMHRQLEMIGFRIKDHTGDVYDDGQPMKVITSQVRPDATRKYVLETLLPTIFWNERIVQHGEIEIAVPPSSNNHLNQYE